ncbi:uncharacterized protein LOC132551153 [Ylistrum balloti]|uniref:uncharacterized protein LOC132551153 n=1 Tax=Ylistrum balloti TaxID=509963 RepID=UPI002905C2E1|nr:uncharacterized protein LOC132551153 [Ylistrum balloti]
MELTRKRHHRKFIPRKKFRKTRIESDYSGIVNLSDRVLNKAELDVLSKGLNFCPTPGAPQLDNILTHTYLFNRRVRINHFFKDTPEQERSPFRRTSGWTPPAGNDTFLDTFLNIVTESIHDHRIRKPHRSNLSNKEKDALKSLSNDGNIVIKPADKGGAIVILNKEDYMQEIHRQIHDSTHYEKVKSDLNPSVTKKITGFLKFIKDRELLTDTEIKYLTPRNPRTPIFYTLSKIHKAGNPGRPIVSQIGSCTEKISEFVDHHLKPLAMKTDSYLKDSNDFLRRIINLGQLQTGSILCTADVSSLYTSIPHTEGIRAVKLALDGRGPQAQPSTWILLRMIALILTNNCFRFNTDYYLQKLGTAMGTKMAPNYAIIFMDYIEKKFLATQEKIPLVWWRYIDDIFFIWTHTREELASFCEAMNSNHPTIKFTFDISDTEVNFLDTTIYKLPDGNLGSKLYNKPTNAFLYLHYHSCHPKRSKTSIPYSQALRIKKICSDPNHFEQECSNLVGRFRKKRIPA